MVWRAMPGQMPQMRFDSEGRKHRMTFVNWCGRTDGLKWEDGERFTPETGFTIQETDTAAGVIREYDVVSPGGEEPPSRAMDQFRVGWRVHCVLMKEEPIE